MSLSLSFCRFCFLGSVGCTLSGSISSIFDPPASIEVTAHKIRFEHLTATLSEGSFGLFNILNEGIAAEDLVIQMQMEGPSGRFAPLPNQLIIPKGSMSVSFILQTVDDNIFQGDAVVELKIFSPGNNINVDSTPMVVSVTDNDAPPSISVSNISVQEGSGSATFAVLLSRPSLQESRISWSTLDGTAISGTNYTQTFGELVIPAGVTSSNISIPIIDTPALCETNRDFSLVLADPLMVILSNSQATATILEDDYPVISVSSSSIEEWAVGAISFSLSAACASQDVSVNYSLTDGTANSPLDYFNFPGIFTIPAGRTTWRLGITTFEDLLVEGSEDLTLTLSTPSHGTLGVSTANLTILDNDVTLQSTTDLNSISAGPRHTCAIRSGAAFCWGLNGDGELGNGSTLPSYIPVPVVGLSSGVTKIASSGTYGTSSGSNDRSCAIANGAAFCWGHQNAYGQLGDGLQCIKLCSSCGSGIGDGRDRYRYF
ncbi:MAG: hypothetical protein IPK04_03860 [Bdellovibrionales bacterium]|nr:hypothetical protein [Bdellovibrionales bacterium]